jgi:hypothetical protein
MHNARLTLLHVSATSFSHLQGSYCDRCRSERLRVLKEKLRDSQIQIEELKRTNKVLEEKLLLTEIGKYVGKRDTTLNHGI